MLTQKILIIDDDPEIVDQLREKTEAFGFKCCSFTSIDHAIEGFKTLKPDLVLMELDFAKSKGAYFLSKIKECLSAVENVPPVIVMNGNDDHAILQYAFDVGTYSFSCTPFKDFAASYLSDYLPNADDETVVSL